MLSIPADPHVYRDMWLWWEAERGVLYSDSRIGRLECATQQLNQFNIILRRSQISMKWVPYYNSNNVFDFRGQPRERNIRVRWAGKSEKSFVMDQLEILFVINVFRPHILSI